MLTVFLNTSKKTPPYFPGFPCQQGIFVYLHYMCIIWWLFSWKWFCPTSMCMWV